MRTVLAESEAVAAALKEAQPGDLIVVFYEKYDQVTAVIEAFRQAFSRKGERLAPSYEQVVISASPL